MDPSEQNQGGQTPEPQGSKRSNEHLGKGARRILARTCSGKADKYCLADFLPSERTTTGPGGKAPVFDADSVAHHQVACEDVEARSSMIVAQFLARDVLNQALMTLGQPPAGSLHQSIEASLANSVITQTQARYLNSLNSCANEAKHGFWFHHVDQEGDEVTQRLRKEPMPGRLCCLCGEFARVPFAKCNYCGETPSYHHGRCCPHKPSGEASGGASSGGKTPV